MRIVIDRNGCEAREKRDPRHTRGKIKEKDKKRKSRHELNETTPVLVRTGFMTYERRERGTVLVVQVP
jgi:hypothetical protein